MCSRLFTCFSGYSAIPAESFMAQFVAICVVVLPSSLDTRTMAQMLSVVLFLGLQTAGANPDWCKWVPDGSLQYVGECAGYSHSNQMLGCVSWCEWVPAPSWQATPQCGKCAELYPNHVLNSTFSSDTCANWCQHVSRPAWQYAPDCVSCEQELANAMQPSKAKAAVRTPKPKAALRASVLTKSAGPSWCQWIPYGSLQYVPACSGGWGNNYPAVTCASWCYWVDSPSWQYIPECQRCYGDLANAVQGCNPECEWVSRPAWANTPGCQQCTAEQNQGGAKTREILP